MESKFRSNLFPNDDLEGGAAIRWQLPSSPPVSNDQHWTNSQRARLNEDMAGNVQRGYQNDLVDSVHTVFQEQSERDSHVSPPQNPHHTLDPLLPISDRSFLEYYEGDAMISYPGDHGEIETVQNINRWVFEARSPLLAAAFESSRSGPQLHLEALTSDTAIPFLRFLYTGSYAVEDTFAEVPTSVLFHCQMYYLGDLWSTPDLKLQAYVNVLRQCEFGCSSPEKPIDLCAAIRYIYQHLRRQRNLLDLIINYCISCFLRHRLGSDEGFQKLHEFHQDLCKYCMENGCDNEVWSAIIQMPSRSIKSNSLCTTAQVIYGLKHNVTDGFQADNDANGSARKSQRQRDPTVEAARQQVDLPYRARIQALVAGEQNGPDNDANLALGCQRNVVPHLPSSYSSLEDYEMAPGPTLMEGVRSNSTIDTEAFVKVELLEEDEFDLIYPLPTCTRVSEAAADAEPYDARSDSDSEWSLV